MIRTVNLVRMKGRQIMKLTKKVMSVVLMLSILLTAVSPVWADEAAYSSWAIQVLNEGEKYGIYPMEWYTEGFLGTIDAAHLSTLLDNVDQKLDVIADKSDFKGGVAAEGTTRGAVLANYYNLLGEYGLVTEGEWTAFLHENGIVNGTGSGLKLDAECTLEQAVIFGINTVGYAYEKLEQGGKGVFWKVENGDTTVYLLGSIHVGSSDQYPLNTEVKSAFEAADALMVEADLLNPFGGLDYFRSKAFYTDGTTLKDHIDADLYSEIEKVFEQYVLDAAIYGTLKPWALANELSVLSMTSTDASEEGTTESAGGANYGIDLYFTINAYLTGKPVVELEGVAYQTDLFDGLSEEFQSSYLGAIVDGILNPAEAGETDSSDLLQEWLTLWIDGDIDGFTESFNQATTGESNELSDMLFGQRDLDMATKVMEILNSNEKATYFVVVGAGHFINPENMIKVLESNGFTVERVFE